MLTSLTAELRDTIYATKEEKKRFRQLIVNAVMATDITDQELKKQRNLRWEKAFQDKPSESEGDEADGAARNRKATIVVSAIGTASIVPLLSVYRLTLHHSNTD